MSDDVKQEFRYVVDDNFRPARFLGLISSLTDKLLGVEAEIEQGKTNEAGQMLSEAILEAEQIKSEEKQINQSGATAWRVDYAIEENKIVDTFQSAVTRVAYSPAQMISESLMAAKEALFGEPNVEKAQEAISSAKEQAVGLKDALEAIPESKVENTELNATGLKKTALNNLGMFRLATRPFLSA